jgi:hypothetical protein
MFPTFFKYDVHQAKLFPQPLLDFDSYVRHKELLRTPPNAMSPGPVAKQKTQYYLFLLDCVLFLLTFLLLCRPTTTTIPYLYLGPWQNLRNLNCRRVRATLDP